MVKKQPDRDPTPRSRSQWRRVGPYGVGALVLVGIIAMAMSVGDASVTGTTRVDPDAVAEGRTLFAANCAVCHGADLKGTTTGPPFLHAVYAPNHHADEAFQMAAALGVRPHHWNFGPMPPVPGLTREDVALIIAFIRSEQEAAGIFQSPSH